MNLKQLIKRVIDGQELTLHESNMLHSYSNKEINQTLNQLQGKIKTFLYMITFTLKHENIDPDEVENYIKAQAKRKALKIIQFQLVKELCKSGRAHFHALVQTTKCLKKDRFNYYIQQYGNIDISTSKTNDPQEIINYLSKQGTIEKII